MKEYTNETPVFSDTMPITETTDVAHPDNINAGPIKAFENTLSNRAAIQKLDAQTSKTWKWTCPVKKGTWSRVLRLKYADGILRVRFEQNSQENNYTYVISNGYGTANINQIGSAGNNTNSLIQIRIMKSSSSPVYHMVEILNPYAYQNSEYITAVLEFEEGIKHTGNHTEIVPLTEYSSSGDDYNYLAASLVSRYDGIVAKKMYAEEFVGSKASVYTDSQGGNIRFEAPSPINTAWEIDAPEGDFRVSTNGGGGTTMTIDKATGKASFPKGILGTLENSSGEKAQMYSSWTMPVTIGQWSRVGKIYFGASCGLFVLRFQQNAQMQQYVIFLSTSDSTVFINQVSATGYKYGTNVEFRVTRSITDTCFYIEVKNNYKPSSSVTTTNAYCSYLNLKTPCSQDTVVSASGLATDDEIVFKTLVLRHDGMATEKFYGNLVSIGEGLSNFTSSYNVLAEGSFYAASTSVYEEANDDTKYHMVRLQTLNMLPSKMAWGSYMGVIYKPNGTTVYADDVKGKYFLTSSNFKGIWVENPDYIWLCYSDKATADQAAANGNSENVLIFKMRESTNSSPASNNMLLGTYNRVVNNADNVLVIGNGTSDSQRSNALRVTKDSIVYLGAGGAYNTSGADCAYRYEYEDGNPNGEDRVGRFVTLSGDKVRIAEEGDYIFGVVSRIAGLIGNSDEEWMGRYMRDDFGRILRETVQLENGEIVERPVQNPEYDPDRTYVPRECRQEWDTIGIWGVIPVLDDGTCIPGRFCKCGLGGVATLAERRGYDTFYVMERVAENIVRIVLKGS